MAVASNRKNTSHNIFDSIGKLFISIADSVREWEKYVAALFDNIQDEQRRTEGTL